MTATWDRMAPGAISPVSLFRMARMYLSVLTRPFMRIWHSPSAHQGHRLGRGPGCPPVSCTIVNPAGSMPSSAHRPDHRLVAHQGGVDDAPGHRLVHRLDGVGVVGEGGGQALAGPGLDGGEHLFKAGDGHRFPCQVAGWVGKKALDPMLTKPPRGARPL